MVNKKNADLYKFIIADKIENYTWNNKKPTAQCWEDGNRGTRVIKNYLKKQ